MNDEAYIEPSYVFSLTRSGQTEGGLIPAVSFSGANWMIKCKNVNPGKLLISSGNYCQYSWQ